MIHLRARVFPWTKRPPPGILASQSAPPPQSEAAEGGHTPSPLPRKDAPLPASRRRSTPIPAPLNLHQRGRVRVSYVGPPHPVSWQRRALVKIDGLPKDEIARGDTDQWLLDPGPHVVRVTDSWGRSRDCLVDVPSRRTVDLHCSNHHARTALVKLLPPLWLITRWLPGLTWNLRPADGPALLAAPAPGR